VINGILVVNKPRGMTSHQVVGKVRRILGIRKIGHTGTLDPDVEGVLPLCIGNATRVAEYMLDQSKSYEGEVTFGYSTTTQDAAGEVVERVEKVFLTESEIRSAFAKFVGEITQVPPAYSAVKVQGKRAYELARKGQEVKLQERKIVIYSLQILSLHLAEELPRVRFRVDCSKGTYIRTLCHDIGQTLGIPSHMSHLVRIRSGPFHLEMAHNLDTLEAFQEAGKIKDLLLSASAAVMHFPAYKISEKQEKRVLNGREMTFPRLHDNLAPGDRIRVESFSGSLLGIYRVTEIDENNIYTKPEKVFKE
jgi:tRNA pseudouridine55 synthase